MAVDEHGRAAPRRIEPLLSRDSDARKTAAAAGSAYALLATLQIAVHAHGRPIFMIIFFSYSFSYYIIIVY